jgi:hypothetical protein
MRSLFLMILLVPALATAQGVLEPGARIRILKSSTAYEPRRTGSVLSVAGDSAIITLNAAPSTTQAFALSRLEVARGHRTHALTGARIGAITGLVLGFVGGYSSGSDCNGDELFVCFDRSTTGGLGAAVGAVYGVIAGGIAGRLIRTDRWVRLAPPR